MGLDCMECVRPAGKACWTVLLLGNTVIALAYLSCAHTSYITVSSFKHTLRLTIGHVAGVQHACACKL
jgi:hypothetical protein